MSRKVLDLRQSYTMSYRPRAAGFCPAGSGLSVLVAPSSIHRLSIDIASRPSRCSIRAEVAPKRTAARAPDGRRYEPLRVSHGPCLESQTVPRWHPSWTCDIDADGGPMVELGGSTEVSRRWLCKPRRPGPQTWSKSLSAVTPLPTFLSPHACKRPELARRHESRKKVSNF